MNPPDHSSPSPQAPDPRGIAYWIGWVIGFTARWALRLLLLLALILLLIYFLIQVPSVQRWAAQQAGSILSQHLEVEVDVGRIDIEPFTKLVLSEVQIGDRQGDTLLVTKRLSTSFYRPFHSLWNRSVLIEAIEVEGANINIYRDTTAPAGNFSFLAALFAGGPDSLDKELKTPFRFELTALRIENSGIRYKDALAGTHADVRLDTFSIFLKALNLPRQEIIGNSLELAGLTGSLRRFDRPPPDRENSSISATGSPEAKDTFLLSRWTLGFEDVDVVRTSLSYTDERTGRLAQAAGNANTWQQQLDIEELAFSVSDLILRPDSLGLTLESFALFEAGGLSIYDFSAGTLSFTSSEILLDEFDIQTGSSRIGDYVRVRIPPGQSWTEALTKGRLNLDLKPSVIQIGELARFVPSLKDWTYFADREDQKIQFSGRITGSTRSLNARDLTVRLPDGSFLAADLGVRNLLQREETVLNVRVEALRTSIPRLRTLLPNVKIPGDFDRLGELSFDGRFDGFLNDFVAEGNLATSLGEAGLNTRFLADPGVLPAYTGALSLQNFDLGAYTNNPELGFLTASADIRRGVGLRPSELELDLIGAVESLQFRGYTYRNIVVNGKLAPESYEGAVQFQDEHADLDFNGKIQLGEDVDRRFDFQANIRKLDLQPLQLTKTTWNFSGDIEVHSNTLNLNDLEGLVTVSDFSLTNPKGKTYQLEKFTTEQTLAPDGTKRLTFDSPLLVANLSGEYSLLNLPVSLSSAFAKTYEDLLRQLPISTSNIPQDSTHTRISFEATLIDTDSLFRAFNLPLRKLDGSQIALTIDTEAENFDFSISSAAPEYQNLALGNFGIDIRGQSGELDVRSGVQALTLGSYKLENIKLFTEYAEGDIRFSVSSDTSTTVVGDVNLAGAIRLEDTLATFSLDPSSHLDLGGERWTVAAGNELVVGNRQFIARDVQLEAGDRFISLESSGLRGMNVLLRQFNLDLFNTYLNPDKIQIQGEIDAYLSVEDIYQQKGMTFSASVDTFRVNEVDWGALQTLVSLDSLQEPLGVYTTFSRLGQQAVLDAQLALAEGVVIAGVERPKDYFDAVLTSEQFDMSFLSYFIPGITDLRGKLGADLRFQGTPEDPVPSGGILVDDCGLTIDYLKTRYFVDSQYVSIDERILDASGRVITDRFGNRATITGGLVHEKLKTWGLDVSLRTNRLEVLRTSKADNPLYYGEAFADGKVAFNGPFNQTDIDIDAKALGGTRVVFPVSGSGSVDELRFINFRQPEDSARQEVASFLRGINLDMDIEVTPVAELLLIFDEAAGDILRGQGTGTIQIDVNRSGSYSMDGVYTITEGDYLFTLLNVVNKPFDIRPGGTINWNGDPFNAQLDLTAAYNGLNVAPYGLIAEYEDALRARSNGSSDGLLQLAYQPTQVDLLMKLTGELQRPDLAFEIELPNLQGDLRNYVNSKLALIRQDENLLNRQVFGLIVIGQFLPEVNELQAGSVGFNTISELFSNQFSYLLTELFTTLAGTDGALSGIDLDLNLQNSSLNTADGTVGNSFQTQLKTYFFEDRLEIGVGANFGRTATSQEAGRLTAGKFEVSYALTEDRRLRLKTFASTDVDIRESSRNRAGVGLSWRREFDSFSELFGEVEKIKAGRKEAGPIIFKPAKLGQ